MHPKLSPLKLTCGTCCFAGPTCHPSERDREERLSLLLLQFALLNNRESRKGRRSVRPATEAAPAASGGAGMPGLRPDPCALTRRGTSRSQWPRDPPAMRAGGPTAANTAAAMDGHEHGARAWEDRGGGGGAAAVAVAWSDGTAVATELGKPAMASVRSARGVSWSEGEREPEGVGKRELDSATLPPHPLR
jgi:hypothetical protein